MDRMDAFDRTIAIAERCGVEAGNGSLGLDHMRDMRERITDAFSDAKFGRWIGWAQGVVLDREPTALFELDDINEDFPPSAPAEDDMDQVGAIHDTIDMVRAANMSTTRLEIVSLGMNEQDALGTGIRLGRIQALAVCSGVGDLEEMKRINIARIGGPSRDLGAAPS